MSGVERHGSGGPFEERFGYSRVVRVGPHVWVSGCTAIGADGIVLGHGNPYEQTKIALETVAQALDAAGARLEHVVRTRLFVTDISRSEDIGRAHGELLGAVRPAASMVEVSALIDPRMLVEIEADAYVID